jgi:hypothetical protein
MRKQKPAIQRLRGAVIRIAVDRGARGWHG